MPPIVGPKVWLKRFRTRRELRELQELWQRGEQVLGDRGWFLLRCYGKVTAGPQSGSYVSSLSTSDVHAMLDALAAHKRIPVHLTHRHRTGDDPGAYTRLGAKGRFVMGFDYREMDA